MVEITPGSPELWRADLHIHTSFSPDSLTAPDRLVAWARSKGLNRIAVTDHNTTEGALIAQGIAPDFVIVGEEIATSEGELIAYFVRDEVPAGLSVEATLRRLADQGAVVSVSHPCDRQRGSALGPETTTRIIRHLDALEVFNARCLFASANRCAAEIARLHGLGLTAGSDAHTLREVGSGYVLLPPFAGDPDSFRQSLRLAEAGGRLTGPLPHFASTIARLRKR